MRLSFYITLLFCLASYTVKSQADIDFNPPILRKAVTALNHSPEMRLTGIMQPSDLKEPNPAGKFLIVEKSNSDSTVRYVYLGRVNSCRSGVCFTDQGLHGKQTNEYFDYFILFNEEGAIQLVRVYNYQATHGSEISSPGWLKQFKGHMGNENLVPGKNIDAISGATISVEGIVSDVQQKTNILGTYLKQQVK